MKIALPDWLPLALFFVTVLTLTLFLITVSTHLPTVDRPPELQGWTGKGPLWGSVAVAGLAVFLTARLAWSVLPGYAVVLAVGGAVLTAPLVLKPFSDRFLDGPAGPVVFAVTALALAVASNLV